MNARLSELALGELTLTPSFDRDVTGYTVSGFTVDSSYTLTCEPVYSGAEITVSVINGKYDSETGKVKFEQTLPASDGQIQIRVECDEGYQYYYINFNYPNS